MYVDQLNAGHTYIEFLLHISIPRKYAPKHIPKYLRLEFKLRLFHLRMRTTFSKCFLSAYFCKLSRIKKACKNRANNRFFAHA